MKILIRKLKISLDPGKEDSMNTNNTATVKQLAYARRIEDSLNIQMPDSMDRYTISQFISSHQKEFLQKEQENNKLIESRIKSELHISDIAREMGFSIIKKGHYLTLKEHDSVIIDTEKNCFWRNSKIGNGSSIGKGGSVIDFVVEFSSMNSTEAIRDLAQRLTGVQHSHAAFQKNVAVSRKAEKGNKKELILPQKASHMRNIFAYLTKNRYIDPEIVQEMVDRKFLYQDQRHNCVFVSRNSDQKPLFACLRGTNTFSRRFVGDLEGCDYNHCFFIDNKAHNLVVTESPIESLSYMALLRRNGQDYHMYDFLSLAGTGKYASVLHHYQEKEYGEIIIGTNNDSGGQESNKAIHKLCQNLPVKLIDQYPEQNDWNDKLKYVIGHGYRSNYIAESKDITDALEVRLDAMMMSDQDSLKSECMNFSSKMLHETNLLPNNMDPYIQNYIQYIQKTYPGKSFKEVLAAEKGHDRIPGKQILHNYNRKQFFRVDLTQESALSL